MNQIARGRHIVIPLINKSGGTVIAGDVVIYPADTDDSFSTTTVADLATKMIGVAAETIENDAAGRIIVNGLAPLVNVTASVTVGAYLSTAAEAKKAHASSGYGAGAFARVITGGATPKANLFGLTAAADIISELDDIGDVAAAAPLDGQYLAWATAEQAWVAVSPPEQTTLDDDPIWTTTGQIVKATGNGAAAVLNPGTEGQVLAIVSGAPAWADAPETGDITTDPAWTQAGQIVQATGNGAAAVLNPGTEGQVLAIVSGAPAWADAAATGDITTDSAWTQAGQIVQATGNGAAAVLNPGAEGQVLAIVSGVPVWAAAPDPGSIATDPIWTTAGQIVQATGAGAGAVLNPGSEGQVLKIVSGIPAWATPAAGANLSNDPTWTQAGQLARATGNGAGGVLNPGSNGQVLTVVTGVPAWATPTGGTVYRTINFVIPGTLVAATGTLKFLLMESCTIVGVFAWVSTSPTGSAIIIDINYDGATLYTTQANRPQIAAGGTYVAATLPDITALVQYHQLSVDVNAIGSTSAGADFQLVIKVTAP